MAIRRKVGGLFVSSLMAVLLASGCGKAAFAPEDDRAIRGLMDQQAAAWSAGDLAGFMEPYADTVCFHSPRGLTCGKEQVLANYQRSYPDKAAMGQLRFDIHELVPAGAEHAWLSGAWALDRHADTLSGAFALLWVKGPQGWHIARDHTY